ncbi:zinc finger, CCHC-type containing protein [Tanacetum coccineum]
MRDANPIRTLGDYFRPSHEGYRNTIELPEGNNVVPLRSDTIRLVQNGCSFPRLRSEDPNQHLKDLLKLVDSLDFDVANKERTRLRLFQFSLHDQDSNWLERLPAGSISTWEDLTTRFLAQLFPPGKTAKLRNDILMFQQHQGESLSEAWTRFKDLLQKVSHHGIDLQIQIFYDHVNPATRRTIDQSAGGKLRNKNVEESWELLEDLALYDNKDVPSTSNRPLIKLENQVQRLMEAHLASKQPIQVNQVTSSCEICNGPHDTQYCMKNPEQAFVDYDSSHTDEAGGLGSNFMLSQDARLSKFDADFKQQQSEMTNKIDTVLKAITDQIAGALPSDTVKPETKFKKCSKETNHPQKDQSQPVTKIRTQRPEEPEQTLEDEFKDLHLNLPVLEVLAHAPMYNAILDKYVESLELGKNGSAFVQGKVSAKMKDPGLFTLPCRLWDSKPFDTLAYLGSCVNIIPLYLFKKLNIGLIEETNHIFGLADGTKSYLVGIVKDVEVHIERLELLNDFYVIDIKKDPEPPLLVGRGFLATANAVIDCRKAKIAVGEGITRSVFRVKELEIGARTHYDARKDFLDCDLLEEWEIARDAEINPFKDVLVFKRMRWRFDPLPSLWFLALGGHLEEIQVTWVHLEKKRTRLRLYTIYQEELCIHSVETAFAIIKRCRHDLSSDGVEDLTTASERKRLKSSLEDSTW